MRMVRVELPQSVFATLSVLLAVSLVASSCAFAEPSANRELSTEPIKVPVNAHPEEQVPSLIPAEDKLFPLLKSHEYDAVRREIKSQLCNAALSRMDRAELLNLLGYVDFQSEKYRSALKDLASLADATDANESQNSARQSVLILKRMGDTYLMMRKTSQAIMNYNLALQAAKDNHFDPNDPLIVDILEAIVGNELARGEDNQAQSHAEQLVSICRARAKSRELFDLGRLFWATVYLRLVYRQSNQKEPAQILEQGMPLLDELLRLRMTYEGKTIEAEESTYKAFQRGLLSSYIAENKPQTLADYLWLSKEFRMQSLPLISWISSNHAPRAVILCVHGLGLENRAFGMFARQMRAQGFAVYAMDVRGFGAWQTEYGTETVNFDQSLADINTVIKILRDRHPGLPLFLLGESMGGAIVLRAASEYGKEMDGVISSVPSPDRYHGKLMALQVALHLVRNPHEPFNIGTEVSNQATKNEQLRELWMRDPRAKTELSPVELIKFDHFMKVTKRKCALIRSTPVIVVQGMADKLVKPKGTYDMYHLVRSSDKTMIIIGNAEHLIFETPNQSQVLLDGLTAWLNNHLTKSQQPTPVETTPGKR